MSEAPTTGTTFDTVTTNREEIERWVRDRSGRPVDPPGEEGRLGIRFPGEDEEGEPMEWDTFFERFDEAGLAFAYDSNAGESLPGEACAFVERERAEAIESEPPAESGAGDTPERVGQADSEPEADQRSTVRTTDARDQENVDNHRDEPPFEG